MSKMSVIDKYVEEVICDYENPTTEINVRGETILTIPDECSFKVDRVYVEKRRPIDEIIVVLKKKEISTGKDEEDE